MNRTSGPEPRPAAEPAERHLVGIPVSPGIAIGPAFGAEEPPALVVRARIRSADIAGETARLDAAIGQSRKQLLKLRARLGAVKSTGRL